MVASSVLQPAVCTAPGRMGGQEHGSSRNPMHLLSKAEATRFVAERRALFDGAGRANPFACSAWVMHFIEHVAEDGWTFVVPECRGAGDSVMLLYSDKKAPHRWSAATNYYASLYSPLISSLDSGPERSAALGELVDQLAGAVPRCAAITFAPLDRQSADTAALRDRFCMRGWYVRQYACFGNWHLPCAGLAFDEYMRSRDSKLYHTWTRKAKKFTDAQAARVEIITEPGDTQAAVDAYERVYARSWKKPEPYPDFVRDWAAICARNGWLRMGVAWAGDVPIAAQFWFTMNRRAYIFKLAYDEDYAKWSAGTVLSAHLFRHALDEDRVVEIDYLSGDDAYKQSWMTERRERVGLIACNPRTPRGLMISAAEFAGEVRGQWRLRAGAPPIPAPVASTLR